MMPTASKSGSPLSHLPLLPNHHEMLLCISNQGLVTVQAPKPDFPERSSVLTMIFHYLLFFPNLLYHSTKSLLNIFTRPFGHRPAPNATATTSENDPQDSNNENTTIENNLHNFKYQQPPFQETRTPLDDKFLEQKYGATTLSIPCTNASSEFDTNNEAWNQTWCFANHITHSLRLQIALEGKMGGENEDEDISALREMEGRVWEGGGEGGKGGDGKGMGNDGGGVGCEPERRRRLSDGTARSGSGRWGFVYLVFVGMVCWYFGGLVCEVVS